MSYTFSIPTRKAPAISALIGHLSYPKLQIIHPEPLSRWPAEQLILCHPQRSTRGVHATHANGQLEICVHVLAAPEDYRLAIQLAVTAAQLTGCKVKGEHTALLPPEQLAAAHDDAWILQTQSADLATTRKLLAQTTLLGVNGLFRTCYFGPNTLAAIGDGPTALGRALDILRRVQWIAAEGYDPASIFSIKNTKTTLTMWFPTKRTLLPLADFIVLADSDPLITFPFDRLAHVLGTALTLIDEHQPLLEPVPANLHPAIKERAQACQVNPMTSR